MAKYEFSGITTYAKLYTPDTKFGNYWKMNLYLDPANLALLKSSGLRLKVHEDEQGSFVTFKKSADPVDYKDGKGPQEAKPPRISYEAEKPPENIRIGNGSKVSVTVDVYDTKIGKGHRLQSVHVEKLVPYELVSREEEVIRVNGTVIPKTSRSPAIDDRIPF